MAVVTALRGSDRAGERVVRPTSLAPMPNRIGPYKVLARLGHGGNAHVFRATSRATGAVAVKLMRPEIADAAAMVVNEFETGCRVNPEYVAAPVAFAADPDAPYVVTRLHARHAPLTGARRGTLSADDLWRLAAGVARALAATHAAGVIHCDVKPANILVYRDSIRLIDFGIARVADDQPDWSAYVHFSRGWAAPEQLAPDPLTPAADVFGWGCVIAALAHGVNPYASATDDEWVEKVQAETPSLDAVPIGLRELVRAALAYHPADRPTAADLAAVCGARRRMPVIRPQPHAGKHALAA